MYVVFECSISATGKLHTSNFIPTNKPNFKNEAFKEGFVFLKIKMIEKFKLENLTETNNSIINQFQECKSHLRFQHLLIGDNSLTFYLIYNKGSSV